MAEIRALYADEDGNILDAPKGFTALARTGTEIVELSPDDLIPLPESADLMFLPDRLPLARYEDEIMPIMGNAVAAILPAGYTRLYMPAFKRKKMQSSCRCTVIRPSSFIRTNCTSPPLIRMKMTNGTLSITIHAICTNSSNVCKKTCRTTASWNISATVH